MLLTGAGIDSATVAYDSAVSQWAAHVRCANDDFVTKVAEPMVNKTIVIALNRVVQSTPQVYPGITGNEVEILAERPAYSRADAVKPAAFASSSSAAPSR